MVHWHFISPLHPEGAHRKLPAKPEPVALPPEPRPVSDGPLRTADVAETARYFLKRGITSRDVIAGSLSGWDRDSVEGVMSELAKLSPTVSRVPSRHPARRRGWTDKILTAMFSIPVITVWTGLQISLDVGMPAYAAVFIDDSTRTYIALPCMAEWQKHPNTTHAEFAFLSTAGEARKLRYDPDDACVQTGAFIEYETLLGHVLRSFGIMPPAQYW